MNNFKKYIHETRKIENNVFLPKNICILLKEFQAKKKDILPTFKLNSL